MGVQSSPEKPGRGGGGGVKASRANIVLLYLRWLEGPGRILQLCISSPSWTVTAASQLTTDQYRCKKKLTFFFFNLKFFLLESVEDREILDVEILKVL